MVLNWFKEVLQVENIDNFFIVSTVFYMGWVGLLIILILIKGICDPCPEWLDQIYDSRFKLFGFIATACAFLTFISKNITSKSAQAPCAKSTQVPYEVPLGLVGSIAGFFAVLLLVEHADLLVQVFLLFLALPVFCVLCLWTFRLYSALKCSDVETWIKVVFIWVYPFIVLLIVWGFIAGILQRLFPKLGVVWILAMSTATLFVPIIIGIFLCWAYIRPN